MGRGACNIPYYEGYQMEAKLYEQYLPLLKKVLGAQLIDLQTRGIVDKSTGTDAMALIEGKVYGISLRFRTKDYQSFTLNRHISDPVSEVRKWSRERSNTIKPAYYLQVANVSEKEFRVIRVNIDSFGYYLKHLIKTDQLESFYKPHLKAYDFPLSRLSNVLGVWNGLFTLQ